MYEVHAEIAAGYNLKSQSIHLSGHVGHETRLYSV